jgi:uncharacterized protein YndB with AHSA1/START domain
MERLLPGPAERIWEHLTNTRLLGAWFGDKSQIEPRQGGSVRLMDGTRIEYMTRNAARYGVDLNNLQR